jgi:hypothetical protein
MKKASIFALLFGCFVVAGGCGDDDDDDGNNRSPEDTGSACEAAGDCYKNLDHSKLSGAVECMDVRDGYCTHLCSDDSDCCKAEGECKTDFKQVCAVFTSLEGKRCFLSCETADLRPAEGTTGSVDADEYCQREASHDFECRASGGGDPRKICMPAACSVGASCGDAQPCTAGLDCLTAFDGGYCGHQDCTTNAGCPADSLCVQHENGNNYCLRKCAGDTDCTLCRGSEVGASCRSDVTFVEAGTTGTVCVPRLAD